MKRKLLTTAIPVLLLLLINFLRIAANSTFSLKSAEPFAVYLPAPEIWEFFFPQHHLLFSALFQARALTYYGSHFFEANKKLDPLVPLLETALRLDKNNEEAFFLTSNLLCPQKTDRAIEILETGFAYHFLNWKFPEMLGFKNYFYLKRIIRAARYYEIASRLPGHPPFVASLSGKFYSEAGQITKAIEVLNNFYLTTRDKRLKKSFLQEIERLQERIRKNVRD